MSNILLYDLEITPILGWTYDMWDARVIRVEQEPQIMSVSWKWLDGDDVDNYNTEYDSDDRFLVKRVWDLMNEADVVVAHNAKKFDNRVASARFIIHGLGPPSPYKTVDTLVAARRYFKFPTNSLNDLCSRLGIGEKPKATHADLWHKCLGGDQEAWDKMVEYNNNDVILLEGLYKKLLPYISNHPNVSLLVGKQDGCPKCGSGKLHYRGYAHTGVSVFRRVQCQDCGGWSRERVARPERTDFVNVTW